MLSDVILSTGWLKKTVQVRPAGIHTCVSSITFFLRFIFVARLDYDRSWSSQEWKSEVAAPDRSGQPDKTSWNAVQQVCPHHGDALLDGIAHSVRYGEMIHEGSGQPDSANYQEVADSETFVIGSDAAEFVNKVKDQVRTRQKRMSNVAESGEEHSIIWSMFMAATMNAATFMGKNFLENQNSF